MSYLSGFIVALFVLLLIIALFFTTYHLNRRSLRRKRKAELIAAADFDHGGIHMQQNALPPSAEHWVQSPADSVLLRSSLIGPHSFTYDQLSIATKGFSATELLGKGGFGHVYKGVLDDGTQVAVKCIATNSSQGVSEFLSEVRIITGLRHRHLVKLNGWCSARDKLLLVYEYMPNGSLNYLLFNDELCAKLTWARRHAIAVGLGSALMYLQNECEKSIIHRDIKSSNVLLDENFHAKLGDFGLSRQLDEGKTSYSTLVAGTRGYMAPECFFGSGKATMESDVFAFGAVLLELATGRRVLDLASLREYDGMLLHWVWALFKQGKVVEALDKRMSEMSNVEEIRRMLMIGLACQHPDPKARPKIKQAVEALLGNAPLPFVPPSIPTLHFGPSPDMVHMNESDRHHQGGRTGGTTDTTINCGNFLSASLGTSTFTGRV